MAAESLYIYLVSGNNAYEKCMVYDVICDRTTTAGQVGDVVRLMAVRYRLTIPKK